MAFQARDPVDLWDQDIFYLDLHRGIEAMLAARLTEINPLFDATTEGKYYIEHKTNPKAHPRPIWRVGHNMDIVPCPHPLDYSLYHPQMDCFQSDFVWSCFATWFISYRSLLDCPVSQEE